MEGYILTFFESEERKGYTTLSALFEENLKENLGVSKHTLDRFDFGFKDYENNLCKIEKLKFKTKGDIIREREMFL